MSLLFWRKTEDTGDSNEVKTVEVNRQSPLPVQVVDNDDEDAPHFRLDPDTWLPPVAGQTITRLYRIPGIGTGAAYTAGEAFGTPFQLHDLFRPEKCSGMIVGMFLIDKDDEGIQIDVPLFTRSIAGTADNSAFAPTDDELMTCRAVISITEFYNWNVNQFGQYAGAPKHIVAESPHLWTQAVIQGAANIAAGSEPLLGIVVVPD